MNILKLVNTKFFLNILNRTSLNYKNLSSDFKRLMNSYSFESQTLFSRLESSIRKNQRVGSKTFFRFFEQAENSPSITREESLVLLQACGSCFVSFAPKERNILTDKVWNLLESKNVSFDISHYNTLLSIYLENGYEFDPKKFLDLLQSRNIEPNRVTFQRMIHRYCLLGDLEGAADILELMKQKQVTINENIFNSLIYGYGYVKNLEAAKNVISLIKSNGLQPNKDTYKALVCVHALYINKGVTEASVDQLLKDISKLDIMWNFSDYFEVIKYIAQADENSYLISKIINNMIKTYGYGTECMNAIISFIYQHKTTTALKLFFSITPSDIVSKNKCQGMFLVDHLVKAGISQNKVFEICDLLIKENINMYSYHKATESALITCEKELAESYLKKFCEISGKSQMHYYWPIICKCKTQNEILKIIKDNLVPLICVTSQSIILETFKDYIWPRIETDKMSIFSNCIQMGFSSNILIKSLISSKNSKNFNIKNEFSIIINELADSTKDIRLVKQLFDLLVSQNYVKINNKILGPRVKVHLLNDDVPGALQEFLYCYKKYGFCPWKTPLMVKLIENGDYNGLQEVIDACTASYGEFNVLIDLAFAFIQAGKEKKAAKIISNPRFRIKNERLDVICEKLIEHRKIDVLEKFSKLTKDIEMDRDKLYFYIIKGYGSIGAPEKILEIWTNMQEENFLPSNRNLHAMALILKEHNMSIPFEIDLSLSYETDETNKIMEKIINELDNKNVYQAMKLRNKAIKDHNEFSLSEECILLEKLVKIEAIDEAYKILLQLINEGRFPSPRILKLILNELSKSGKSEQVENLRGKLPITLEQSTWFSGLLINCFINSKKSNEFLIDFISKCNPLPIGSFLNLMRSKPELYNDLKDIAYQFIKNYNNSHPLNMVWIYLMECHRFDEADEIFESNEKFKDTLLFNFLIEKIKKDSDVKLAERLKNTVLKTNLNPRTIGSVYSVLINILIDKNLLENAESLLVDALKKGENKLTIYDFTRNVVLRLYHGIKAAGRDPKFGVTEHEITESILDSENEEAEQVEIASPKI